MARINSDPSALVNIRQGLIEFRDQFKTLKPKFKGHLDYISSYTAMELQRRIDNAEKICNLLDEDDDYGPCIRAWDKVYRLESLLHVFESEKDQFIETLNSIESQPDLEQSQLTISRCILLIEKYLAINFNNNGNQSSKLNNLLSNEDKTLESKLNQSSQDWQAQLTDLEFDAIRDYTQLAHNLVNSFLRGYGATEEEQVNELGNRIHLALQRAQLPDNMILFRGENQMSALNEYLISHFQQTGEPVVLINDGFMSTTTDFIPDFTNRPNLLVIDAPRGSNGAFVSPLSYYPNENEILFDRGQLMRLMNVSIENGQRIIEVALMK